MPRLATLESRNDFVRGVYLLLSIEFTTIALASLFPLLNRELCTSLQNNIEVFVITSLSLLVLIAIAACFALHRRVPWNAPMLAVFTIGWCILMATVSAAAESYGAVFVFATLAVICLLIAIISCVEHWNPMNWISVLVLLILVLVFYIFAFFFIKESPEVKSIALALSLVLILYLLIDTVSIMARPNLKLESDEVVFGVLTLHLDGLVLIADEVVTKCSRA